jgi:hypothetical protein
MPRLCMQSNFTSNPHLIWKQFLLAKKTMTEKKSYWLTEMVKKHHSLQGEDCVFCLHQTYSYM